MMHKCPICKAQTDSAVHTDFPSAASAAVCGTWATGPAKSTWSPIQSLMKVIAQRSTMRKRTEKPNARRSFSICPTAMTTNTSATVAPETPRKKPRIALAIASALGVGYIPKSPGTFGSLAGIVVAILTHPVSLLVLIASVLLGGFAGIGIDLPMFGGRAAPVLLLVPSLVALLLVGLIGVWSSSRAAA